MLSLLLKELIYILLFVFTVAGVVSCGSPKKRSRTSSIVQFISSGSVVISENSENILDLDSFILNTFSHLDPIWIYNSHCMALLRLKIQYVILASIASSFRLTEED